MKRNTVTLWACVLFFCCLSTGCSDLPSLDPDKPVTLTFWHVFGAQADSPMNALVDRFNQTVGREKGIVVSVTSVSNSTDIHFALVAAAKREPGAGSLPDMFVSYPKTVLAIGPERMVDWTDWLSEATLTKYVPSFVEEGRVGGRLALLPIAKSSSALFINATIFDQFAEETDMTYDDLATWEGMFRAAKRYSEWSGGNAFFKYDDWLHYSMLNTASLGGNLFQDGAINFRDEQFINVWSMLAECAVGGGVCPLGGYSTTAMMTGESVCGIESTASILYFKDTVTFPDNTTAPLRLNVLPVPIFEGGEPLAIQRGGGLGVLKSTPQKEYAASIFGQWLTEEENNVPFVMATGYFPVKKEAYQAIVTGKADSFPSEAYKKLYAAIAEIYSTRVFYVPPFFDGYGEVERTFSEAQRGIFATYKAPYGDAEAMKGMAREMFLELERAMR